MKRFLLVGLLTLLPTLASAQCNGTFPNNTVCGNITGSANLPRATSPSAFLGAAGGTNGQQQYNNAGALGGFTQSGDVTVNTSTGVSTIGPDKVLTGMIAAGAVGTTDIANNAVTNGKLATNAVPIFATRAAAAALDLSAFTAIKTQSYDGTGLGGGGASFIKIGAVPFKDTYVLTGTVTAGTGYTNGTYKGVALTGGTGSGCLGTVTVAGTVVTVVNIAGTYCVAYAVGDVLTITQSQVGGTGSGATFTIATISTQLGSFVDAAANRWQITIGDGAWPNVKQFGAKIDWSGTDGSATNDVLSFRSAIAFANVQNGSAAAFVEGTKLLMPTGAAYLCATGTPFETLNIPRGVTLIGAGPQGGSTLKQCTAESATSHFISLCNPQANVAGGGQFNCAVKDMTLYSPGSANNGVYMVYSNAGQQFPLLDNVLMVTGSVVGDVRGCVQYEVGAGGASNAIFQNIDCERSSTTVNNAGMFINSSNTQVVIRNAVFGCAPGNCGSGIYAITKQAGNLIVDTMHVEQHVDVVSIATASTDLNSIRNVTIGAGCVNGIVLGVLNPNNTVLFENIQSSCSTATIVNGHAGGANFVGNILKPISCNPGAPCN